MDHGLGFWVWDVDTPAETKPLWRSLGGKTKYPAMVLHLLLCRGSDQGRVAVASWHPDIFGPHGCAVWHSAVDETVAHFDGAIPASRSLIGAPSRLIVDGTEIPARRIDTGPSQLVISADEMVPVAVIYSTGLDLPTLSTADWAVWRMVRQQTPAGQARRLVRRSKRVTPGA